MRVSKCDGEEVICSSSQPVDGGGQDSGDREELPELSFRLLILKMTPLK